MRSTLRPGARRTSRTVGGMPEQPSEPSRLATFNLLHGMRLGTGTADPADLARPRPGSAPTSSGCRRSTGTRNVPAASTRCRWWPRPSGSTTGGSCRRSTGPQASRPTGPRRRPTTGRTRPGRPTASASRRAGRCVGGGYVASRPRRSRCPCSSPASPTAAHPHPRRAAHRAGRTRGRPGGPFTVVTCHLSFVPGYNVSQLRAIVRWVARMPQPVVVLGDLNLPGSVPRWASGWAALSRGRDLPVLPATGAARPRAGARRGAGGRTRRARPLPRRERPLRPRRRPRPGRRDPPRHPSRADLERCTVRTACPPCISQDRRGLCCRGSAGEGDQGGQLGSTGKVVVTDDLAAGDVVERCAHG